MQLNVADSVSPSNWDTNLCKLGGTIFHSVIWAKYTVGAHSRAIPQYLYLTSDRGEFLGFAIGFLERPRYNLLRARGGFIWFDALPVVLDDDSSLFASFLQLILQHFSHLDIELINLASFASANRGGILEAMGFSLHKRFEFELSLLRSESELWDALDYKRRKNIRKAIRKKVSIQYLNEDLGVEALRRLQDHSGQRILNRGGPDIKFDRTGSYDPVRILVKSGCGHLIGAFLDGEIVSASLFTNFNGLVYHTLSGHSQKALEAQAPTLLIWEMIQHFKKSGAKRFNLGGCNRDAVLNDSSEHGVYIYKSAFGARPKECTSGIKEIRQFPYTIFRTVGSFCKSMLFRVGLIKS